VQINERLTATIGQDLDFAPADASDAGAQGLHHRFLGGEADRKLANAAAAVGYLERRVDAAEESLRVAFQGLLDAVDRIGR